ALNIVNFQCPSPIRPLNLLDMTSLSIGTYEYYSELQKENHDLRQQLAKVKQQLATILEELQKLKNNSTGNGLLPYVIGGSALVAMARIFGYLVVRKKQAK
ncbi:20593_t:CDS:2, partial [Gigaspora rosea]